MKRTNNYEINPINETIIITKKFYKAASILNTPEYKELMAVRRDNPSFRVVLRTIAQNDKKKTYKNLTLETMKVFITNLKDHKQTVEQRLEEFEAIKLLSKVQPSPFSWVRSWFLANYGAEYNMYHEKDEIEAVSKANTASNNNNDATQNASSTVAAAA